MNKFDEFTLVDAIGNIDDQFVVERVEKMKITHTKRKVVAAIIAASLAVVATVSVGAAVINKKENKGTKGKINVVTKADDTENGTDTENDKIILEVENNDGAECIEDVYSFAEIPDGFILLFSEITESHNLEHYVDSSNEQSYIAFGQYLKENYHDVELDAEIFTIETYVDDEGNEYTVAKNNVHNDMAVVWDHGDYVFTVNSSLDFFTTMELCKNVCEKN